MDKASEKKHYIAPGLTVVSFRTERGYAASRDFLMGVFVPEEQTVETRRSSGGYFGDGGASDEEHWF